MRITLKKIGVIFMLSLILNFMIIINVFASETGNTLDSHKKTWYCIFQLNSTYPQTFLYTWDGNEDDCKIYLYNNSYTNYGLSNSGNVAWTEASFSTYDSVTNILNHDIGTTAGATGNLVTFQIIDSNVPVYNSQSFTDKTYEPEPTNDDINNYNYGSSMIRFLKPSNNEVVTTKLKTYYVNGKIYNAHLLMGGSGNVNNDIEVMINKHILDTSLIKLDGTEVKPGNIVVQVKSMTKHSDYITSMLVDYTVQIQFTLTVSDNGNHSIYYKAEFLNDGVGGFIWSPTYPSITLETTRNYSVNIDNSLPINNDDNNKDGTDFASGFPNRENYPDGIIGDVQFGFDTIKYIVTLPFKLISALFNILSDYFQKMISWVGVAAEFLKTCLSFLPYPIPDLVILSFIVGMLAFVLSVFRR